MQKTEIMKRFIHRDVVKALVYSRLDYDHPIGEVLEREAEIVGQPGCVRVLDESGGWIMLEDRIKELKSDPRYAALFLQPEAKIAKGSMEQLSQNFDAIAAGKVEVQ
ncbi:MAG TPA: hypothetical protein VFO46_08830 [Candidatus Sulfotelmatobacter sp.]|nr:hypothetical protein [Candidatus Sulfotelmatobacter sp.]